MAFRNGSAYLGTVDLNTTLTPGTLTSATRGASDQVHRAGSRSRREGSGNEEGAPPGKQFTLTSPKNWLTCWTKAGFKSDLTRKSDTFVDLPERPTWPGVVAPTVHQPALQLGGRHGQHVGQRSRGLLHDAGADQVPPTPRRRGRRRRFSRHRFDSKNMLLPGTSPEGRALSFDQTLRRRECILLGAIEDGTLRLSARRSAATSRGWPAVFFLIERGAFMTVQHPARAPPSRTAGQHSIKKWPGPFAFAVRARKCAWSRPGGS